MLSSIGLEASPPKEPHVHFFSPISFRLSDDKSSLFDVRLS